MVWEPAALMLIASKFCCPRLCLVSFLSFFFFSFKLSAFPEISFLGVEAERRGGCGRRESYSDVAVTPTGHRMRLLRSYITVLSMLLNQLIIYVLCMFSPTADFYLSKIHIRINTAVALLNHVKCAIIV